MVDKDCDSEKHGIRMTTHVVVKYDEASENGEYLDNKQTDIELRHVEIGARQREHFGMGLGISFSFSKGQRR